MSANKKMKHLTYGVALCALSFLTITSAQAAGFYLQEQSVSGQGASYAGEAAMARDASTIFFNPAGMTYLEGRQMQIGLHGLAPMQKLKNTGSTGFTGLNLTTTPSTPTAVNTLGGSDGEDPIGFAEVPNIFIAAPVNIDYLDKPLWIGLGVTAPFGLSNDYGQGFFARYDSTRTSLKTIDIAPTVAYEVTDWLSVGAGFDAQYVNVTLQNSLFNPSAVAPAAIPGSADGFQSLEGTNWSAGFNAGIMLEPTESTRIGLTYRSEVDHDIKGSSERSGVGTVLQLSGIRNGLFSGTANLDLPAIATIGIKHDIDPKWTVMAGGQWFDWSNFKKIRTVFDDNLQPVSDVAQNYNDTWAFNIGFEYKYSEELTLRSGYQYDPTPTKDNFRTTRTPDGDRNWLSGGLTYKLSDKLTLDAAVTYITVSDEDIALTRQSGLVTINGKTEDGQIFIGSLGMTYKF